MASADWGANSWPTAISTTPAGVTLTRTWRYCTRAGKDSNGKLHWLGNICASNPRGNLPRRPFYLGEVDQETGLLIRDSLILIDDRQPGEDAILTLSNLYARENRETRQIALHMTRMFTYKDGWVGDAYLYRIDV